MRQDNENNEDNPAMGWRALRLSLERDGLMKVQARALLEAAAGRHLYVMFPLVSEPWEFDAAKALFVAQHAWLTNKKKKQPLCNRYGAMREVPELEEVMDNTLHRLAYRSVGTKDMTR